MQVRDILARNGGQVFSVDRDASVEQALEALEAHQIGAVLVRSTSGVEGIFTERDLVHASGHGRDLGSMRVSEVMSRHVITAAPGDDVDCAMREMIERHVRHLPVVEGERLLGMISIRDLVAAHLSDGPVAAPREDAEIAAEYGWSSDSVAAGIH